jgi:uncharacterized protein
MRIYQTLAGSRLYGYHRPDSDWDYRGVFLAPANQLIGLTPLIEATDTNDNGYDIVDYELRKFCKLAMAGNPNILEILFSKMPTEETPEWDTIRQNRHMFLSSQLRKPYSGFLLSEIKKLDKDYSPKGAANAYRLAAQGIEILANGDFNPTLNTARQRMMRDIREGRVDKYFVMAEIGRLDAILQTIDTTLPDEPKRDIIESMVMNIYMEHLV